MGHHRALGVVALLGIAACDGSVEQSTAATTGGTAADTSATTSASSATSGAGGTATSASVGASTSVAASTGAGAGGMGGVGGNGAVAGTSAGAGGAGGVGGNGAVAVTSAAGGAGGAGGMGGMGGSGGTSVASTSASASSTSASTGAGGAGGGGPLACGAISPNGPGCQSGAPGDGDNCGDGATSCCAVGPTMCGTFDRNNNAAYPATVSTFALDKYEVTVGRFRKFVENMIVTGYGSQWDPPATGSGAHPLIPGSGWKSQFNFYLPADANALKAALGASCHPTMHTWTDQPGPNENRPIACPNWYEAFVFCLWDGGRLPTEAEWNLAAAGGAEQRARPWGAAAIDPTLASYDCTGDGSPAGLAQCAVTDLLPGGSRSPAGDGKWGHADLFGNVGEWTLDNFSDPLPTPCVDCAYLAPSPARIVRGRHFAAIPFYFDFKYDRAGTSPGGHAKEAGIRCAR